MAAEQEILQAVRALCPLRRSIEDFAQFEQKAKEALSSLYEKYRSGQSSLEKVRNSQVAATSMIERELKLWLKAVHRRLSPCCRARNPWTIHFTRDMPEEIFALIMEAVRKARSGYGVSFKSTPTADTITYTHENRLLRDFARLSQMNRGSVSGFFFKKTKEPRKGYVKLAMSTEKPLVLSYFKRKCCVTLECHYSFTNEFGYVFES